MTRAKAIKEATRRVVLRDVGDGWMVSYGEGSRHFGSYADARPIATILKAKIAAQLLGLSDTAINAMLNSDATTTFDLVTFAMNYEG